MIALDLLDSAGNVAFAFHDTTGASNPSGLISEVMHDFNLGSPAADNEFFEGEGPGGALARQRFGLVETTFRAYVKGSSRDNLLAGVGTLGRLLSQGGTLRWIPESGASTKYIDFLTGDIPGLFRGQNLSLMKVIKLLQDPDGLPIRIWRQPYLRGAEVTVGPTAVPNDPSSANGCVMSVTVNSEAPVPAILEVIGDAGAAIGKVLVGVRSAQRWGAANLTTYMSTTKRAELDASGQGWTVTLGTNTVASSDPPQSGGDIITVNNTTTPTTLLMRSRATRTSELDSLRGEWQVWLAHLPGNTAVRYQLRWGIGSSVVHTEDEVVPTVSGAWWNLMSLGTIKVPESPTPIGGLTLELWTRVASGGAVAHYADYFLLVPADEQVGILKIPTGLTPVGANESLVSDPSQIPPVAEKRGSDGFHRFLLDVEGPTPLELQPGENVLTLKFLENTNHRDIMARTPTVRVRYAPRYFS